MAHARAGRDEFISLPTVLQQSAALTIIGDRPLIVVTAVPEFRLTIDEGRHRSPDEAGRLPATAIQPARRQPKATPES